MRQVLKAIRRSFRRRAATSAAVILTVAGVIAANAVVFSLLYGILFTPLPYPEPDRVVAVWPEIWFSKGMFQRFAEEARSFESLGAFSGSSLVMTEGGEPTLVPSLSVTVGFLRALQVAPEDGRLFVEGEDRPGAPPTAILGHSLWKSRFGGLSRNPGCVVGDRSDPCGGGSRRGA